MSDMWMQELLLKTIASRPIDWLADLLSLSLADEWRDNSKTRGGGLLNNPLFSSLALVFLDTVQINEPNRL